jgi:hypothetical protein
VFLVSEGVIRADFLPRGVRISAQYYNSLLQNDVHYAIRKKTPEVPSKKIFLLHDNACPQTANLAKATLVSMGWAGKP